MFLEWEMFQTEAVEKIKIRILCFITFFPKILPFEIMSKNVVKPDRSQMTIWRRVPWDTKATRAQAHARVRAPITAHTYTHMHSPTCAHTHTEICSTYCFSTATMIRERASVMRYTSCSSRKIFWHITTAYLVVPQITLTLQCSEIIKPRP